jgi:hypothetical protein
VGQANNLLEHWSGMDAQAGGGFVKEKLNGLAQRRAELEKGIIEADEALQQVSKQSVNAETVKNALSNISEIYLQLKPLERRELIGLVLKRAEVREREIALEIYALGEQHLNRESVKYSQKVCEPPIWLPELVAQSVLRDAYPCHLQSLERRCQQGSRNRLSMGKAALACEWQNLITTGVVKNRAELARKNGVSRARITQLLGVK